jgi:hypothetical protein
MAQEEAAIGQTRLGAEEGKSSRLMEFDQPGEEQAAEEHAQHPHRQEEGRTRRYPAPPVERDSAARHDHVDTHVWSTAVMPMRAPRCFGSAAIVIIVSDAARNSRS